MPGSTSISVTTAAIVPTLLRITAPSARASTASTARYRPAPTTARTAPGSVKATGMPLPAKTRVATRNATSAAAIPTTAVVAATTIVFAPSTVKRCGVAASVARIEPVAYSLVIASAPSAAAPSWAWKKPLRPHAGGSVGGAGAVAANTAPRLTIGATVASSAQYVERPDQSFVHSAWTTSISNGRDVSMLSALRLRSGVTGGRRRQRSGA